MPELGRNASSWKKSPVQLVNLSGPTGDVTVWQESFFAHFGDALAAWSMVDPEGPHKEIHVGDAGVVLPSNRQQPSGFLRDLRTRRAATQRSSVRGTGLTLPRFYRQMIATIESSRDMLTLEPNWDDCGSAAVSHEAWRLAARFLISNINRLWEESGDYIVPPVISPGPNGSVDLMWKTSHRYLLINIRAGEELGAAGFYGDDGAKEWPIKGKLDLAESNMWIFLWLVCR